MYKKKGVIIMRYEKVNRFRGSNRLCRTCYKDCKQFENAIVAHCPMYKHINYVGKIKKSGGQPL